MWMWMVDGWCDPSGWDRERGWMGMGGGSRWDIYRLYLPYLYTILYVYCIVCVYSTVY